MSNLRYIERREHTDGGLLIHSSDVTVVLFDGGGISRHPNIKMTEQRLASNARVHRVPGVLGVKLDSAVASILPDGGCSGEIVK